MSWRSKPYGLKLRANDIIWDGKSEYFESVISNKRARTQSKKEIRQDIAEYTLIGLEPDK